jgi:hypothetical protein
MNMEKTYLNLKYYIQIFCEIMFAFMLVRKLGMSND